MQTTKEENSNSHLCKTETCFNVLHLMDLNAPTRQEYPLPSLQCPVHLHVFIQAAQPCYRLGPKTLARLVSSPKLEEKREQEVMQASFPLCAGHKHLSAAAMTQHSS